MTDDASLQAAIHEDVRLHAYDSEWPQRFEIERARLLALLPGTFLDIQHIGSTAVPGLVAKPVIDLLAGVASMDVARSLGPVLCASGYTTSAEFNATLTDRQWFMRWADGHRTHHLHVVVHGREVWFERLRFRDALRASPVLVAQYAALKQSLAQQHGGDREAYTEAKAEFVRAMSADVAIRPATSGDSEAIVQVLRRSIVECCADDHRGDPGALAAWLDNKTPANVAEWLLAPGASGWVATGPTGVVGFALSTGDALQLLYVLPEALHQGVGRRLLAAVEAALRVRGVRTLRLESTRTALPFYRRHGYAASGAVQVWAGMEGWPLVKALSPSADAPIAPGAAPRIHTRRLTPADAAIFQTLRLAALQDTPSAFGSSHEEERDFPPSVIEARLALKPDRGPFGAFDGDTLVGLVALGRENLKQLAHKALVWGLYVRPDYRGRGIARALLHEALSLARSVPGVRQVNLSVNADNAAAIRLYESFGFEAFGREPGALQVAGVLHDELHMGLRLDREARRGSTPLGDRPHAAIPAPSVRS